MACDEDFVYEVYEQLQRNSLITIEEIARTLQKDTKTHRKTIHAIVKTVLKFERVANEWRPTGETPLFENFNNNTQIHRSSTANLTHETENLVQNINLKKKPRLKRNRNERINYRKLFQRISYYGKKSLRALFNYKFPVFVIFLFIVCIYGYLYYVFETITNSIFLGFGVNKRVVKHVLLIYLLTFFFIVPNYKIPLFGYELNLQETFPDFKSIQESMKVRLKFDEELKEYQQQWKLFAQNYNQELNVHDRQKAEIRRGELLQWSKKLEDFNSRLRTFPTPQAAIRSKIAFYIIEFCMNYKYLMACLIGGFLASLTYMILKTFQEANFSSFFICFLLAVISIVVMMIAYYGMIAFSMMEIGEEIKNALESISINPKIHANKNFSTEKHGFPQFELYKLNTSFGEIDLAVRLHSKINAQILLNHARNLIVEKYYPPVLDALGMALLHSYSDEFFATVLVERAGIHLLSNEPFFAYIDSTEALKILNSTENAKNITLSALLIRFFAHKDLGFYTKARQNLMEYYKNGGSMKMAMPTEIDCPKCHHESLLANYFPLESDSNNERELVVGKINRLLNVNEPSKYSMLPKLARNMLFEGYKQLAMKNFTQAINYLSLASASEHSVGICDNPGIRLIRAVAFLENGDYRFAFLDIEFVLQKLSKLYKMNPENSNEQSFIWMELKLATYLQSILYEKLGYYKNAVDCAEYVLKQPADYVDDASTLKLKKLSKQLIDRLKNMADDKKVNETIFGPRRVEECELCSGKGNPYRMVANFMCIKINALYSVSFSTIRSFTNALDSYFNENLVAEKKLFTEHLDHNI